MSTTIWVCQTNPAHTFDEPTADYYCPFCPPLEGILLEVIKPEQGQPLPTAGTTSPQATPPPPPPQGREVGLCVLLMDASSSMTDPAFNGSPLTRMRLVSNSAASGIFDLERMQNNPNAYVAGFKFDDRVELMFMDTVANLIGRFGDVRTFANYLYDELFKMQQGTDINKALRQAHAFVDRFLKKDLTGLPFTDYQPMMQRIFKFNSIDTVSIANVRVMIYTDGMQYDSNGNRDLLPNPFKTNPLPLLNHDIVIGAFFGQASDNGCHELQSILSNCPIHNSPQFFLFDKPANIGDLKYLFRMASGASGFCPRCLEKQLKR